MGNGLAWRFGMPRSGYGSAVTLPEPKGSSGLVKAEGRASGRLTRINEALFSRTHRLAKGPHCSGNAPRRKCEGTCPTNTPVSCDSEHERISTYYYYPPPFTCANGGGLDLFQQFSGLTCYLR